jgi:aminoglycoside phosphotransferase family enzyme/predicted kinase
MDDRPDSGDMNVVRATAVGADIRETHSGVVVLVGDRAYKTKKAVLLPFLDFRTPEARRHVCEREIELNRRLAPDVYLDLAVLSGSDGRVCEYVIVMRRMPENARLSTMVEDGADVRPELRSVARLMADFHAAADRGPRVAAEGRAEGLRRRWLNNLGESERFRGSILDAGIADRVRELALRYVAGRAPLLAQRVAAGLVVDGHGDLMADDIFCLPDFPRVLDCLEFDDRLRYVDVLDDVALLAVDLERLGRPALAREFLDAYLEFSGSTLVDSLWRHYLAYRAFMRAKVHCFRAEQGDPRAAQQAASLAAIARQHLEESQVRLVLVGGAPGTGKSTLSRSLAERLGAVVLSTDEIRREAPGPAVYTAEATAAIYAELVHRARQSLQLGRSVIADATWPDGMSRESAVRAAVGTQSVLTELECRAPVGLAAARAERRLLAGGAASDAGGAVAAALAAAREPWHNARAIDTTAPPETALGSALAEVLSSV